MLRGMTNQATETMHRAFERPGATLLPNGRTRFEIWAPEQQRLAVHQLTPTDRILDLDRDNVGHFSGEFADVPAGATYKLRLDNGRELPDPASRFQPEGVHGPSVVVG